MSIVDTTTSNDDWFATCSIYNICEDESTREFPGFCTIQIPLNAQNTAFVRSLKPREDGNQIEANHRYAFCLLSPENVPVFRLKFRYTTSLADPLPFLDSVEVSMCHYEHPWPAKVEQPWLNWLNARAADLVAENQISFVVCEFVEHQALSFFDPVRDENGKEVVDLSLLVLNEYPFDSDNNLDGMTIVENVRWAVVDDKYRRGGKDTIHGVERVKKIIVDRWKEWEKVDCPICFERLCVAEAVEISCGHFFCFDCISTYARTTVGDIRNHRVNPFKCPVQSCREDMKLVACVKKLLSREEMDEVRQWYKNLKNPPTSALRTCLSKKCGWRAMRRTTPSSDMVYCEACGVTRCDLCLRVICDEHRACDPDPVLRLCYRYKNSKGAGRRTLDEKWPWLGEYASFRVEDDGAAQWVKEHGQRCPQCKVGIERLEGCFHMRCSECATHFCYECGETLYPPYYGTHHCWEEGR